MKMFTSKFSCWTHKISMSGLAVFLVVALGVYSPKTAQAQPGIVYTAIPNGGFAIDGNLLSRIPTTPPFSSGIGDFLPNEAASGTGGHVFTLEGVPVDTATAFHIIDGFDNYDLSIFTEGSKLNNDPNTWKWKTGKPTTKDDINHALFFFANDSLGNIWFVGSGDRKNTNGNTYLDFELLQNPLYKNEDGTFSSSGPHGGRTIGDLVITINYTIGGSNPQLFIYKWNSTGQGSFGYTTVTPAVGTTFLATNKDSTIVVPYVAFGANSYMISAFTEVACNLNELIPGSCLKIKTVIVKTKASQSVNAVLKDFVTPVHVNIGSAPEVSVNSATICSGDSATLTATILSGSGPYSYQWNTGDSTQSITVSPDTTTQYTVVVTGLNGCSSNPVSSTVTIIALPVCFISDPDSICPSDIGQFFGPDSLYSYAWTISGSGTILGDSTEQMVYVQGNGACDSSFTLTLAVMGAGGCMNSSSKTIYLLDHISPVIENLPGPVMLQCASQVPNAMTDTVTASDNCGGSVTLNVSDQVNDLTCPNHFTLIRTWTATDICGNFTIASQSITVSDTMLPVLEGVPADTIVCCADSIPPPGDVVAFDNCDSLVTVSFYEVISDSTANNQFTLTRTWTAMDSCNNIATASQVIIVNDTLSIGGNTYSSISTDDNVIINFDVSPNPFINNTSIKFSLSMDANVSVELYSYMGVMLQSIYKGNVLGGANVSVNLAPDASIEAGTYLIILRTNHGSKVLHIVLMR